MKKTLKKSVVLSAVFISSCNFFKEDACYDINHIWDPENKICTDSCVRQGGIFDIPTARCEIPLSGAKKIKDKALFASVQTACYDVQKILKADFNISNLAAQKHSYALQSRYGAVASEYTDKYNYGQDGVCNFALDNHDKIKVLIRKNARIKSQYSIDEFDILKIEKRQTNIEKSQIIWERD